ncbi:mariner Mos1 transposase [Trichonephila clavipes]|nr:mariner Mos1 transposase [Trichonephila clavipes]
MLWERSSEVQGPIAMVNISATVTIGSPVVPYTKDFMRPKRKRECCAVERSGKIQGFTITCARKKFEVAELPALLDEDDGRTHEHLSEQLNVDQSTVSRRLKAMGKIIKVSRWVPHELTDRQQENQKIACKMLLAHYKRKSYLLRIVTGDEKWIYFENFKRNQSYVDPGQPSKSTTRSKCFGHKTMLCIFWDQQGPIYYELLNPGETVNTDSYKQQLLH